MDSSDKSEYQYHGNETYGNNQGCCLGLSGEVYKEQQGGQQHATDEIEKMSVNLCAPIIIGGESRNAVQVITDDKRYPVKYPIYDILKAAKERAGD